MPKLKINAGSAVRPPQRPTRSDLEEGFYKDGAWDESHSARISEITSEEDIGGDEAYSLLVTELEDDRDDWISRHEEEVIHDHGSIGNIDMLRLWEAWRDGYLEASRERIPDLPVRLPRALAASLRTLLKDPDPNSMQIALDLILENNVNLAAWGEQLAKEDGDANGARAHVSIGSFWLRYAPSTGVGWTCLPRNSVYGIDLLIEFEGVQWLENEGGPSVPMRIRTQSEHDPRRVVRRSEIDRIAGQEPHVVTEHTSLLDARREAAIVAWDILYRMKWIAARNVPAELEDPRVLMMAIRDDDYVFPNGDTIPPLRFDNRELVPNPRGRRQLVPNPAWVTHAVADSYETIATLAPPSMLPKLADVHGGPKATMQAKMTEYGCGAYGCVLPTMDDNIVLKVTTDDTEAEFASELANDLVAPICVVYEMVMSLPTQHQGRNVYLLWRESAEDVGNIDKVLGERASRLVNKQHDAAKAAYIELHHGRDATKQLEAWVKACDQMGFVPELRALADGMVDVYTEQRVFIADVHIGNLGLVTRAGRKLWVITDPGNVVVLTGDGRRHRDGRRTPRTQPQPRS